MQVDGSGYCEFTTLGSCTISIWIWHGLYLMESRTRPGRLMEDY